MFWTWPCAPQRWREQPKERFTAIMTLAPCHASNTAGALFPMRRVGQRSEACDTGVTHDSCAAVHIREVLSANPFVRTVRESIRKTRTYGGEDGSTPPVAGDRRIAEILGRGRRNARATRSVRAIWFSNPSACRKAHRAREGGWKLCRSVRVTRTPTGRQTTAGRQPRPDFSIRRALLRSWNGYDERFVFNP